MEKDKKIAEVVEIDAVDEDGMVDALRFAMIQAKVTGKRNIVDDMIEKLVAAGWGRSKIFSKIGWLTTRVYFDKREGLIT